MQARTAKPAAARAISIVRRPMETRIVPVILAGGSGTRLWPVSRDSLPKQFQRLIGDLSTYQQTLERVADRTRFADPIVVTNDESRFFAQRQAADVGIAATLLIEPERRDSAAALAAAASYVDLRYGPAIVLALAADHIVRDVAAFAASVAAGAAAAADGAIVTFGIEPTEPATGYGYIRPGAAMGEDGVRAVAAFMEKPDAASAERYIAQGCMWNSGNFLFSTSTFLEELERLAPEIAAAARAAVEAAKPDLGFVRLDPESFSAAPKTSIDYALMEKTERAAVVPGSFGWSDIGSWDAILKISETDQAGNKVEGPVEAIDAKGCLLRSDGPVLGAVGIENIVVVATADAVLVADRGHAGDVKTLVEQLRRSNKRQATQHQTILRPWGSYESIDRGERFQVKRIVVEPGGKLSLQKHMHRAEHWVVVRGTAEVTIDDEVRFLAENQSVYIPLGATHRLANPGKIPVELIEVQTGSYLEEDDIIRLEDVYQRS
jgi:mannose-1-phosphate guanylyltransferase/mannose-6-phosphate isomerase